MATAGNVMSDYESKTSIEYAQVIQKKISLLISLINSLFVDKIMVKGWLIWVEPTIFKLTMHTSSFLNLFWGSIVYFNNKEIKFFDEPSVILQFRAILENYLTLYYLFFDSISEAEKIFRINVWKYSALKQRSGFTARTPESQNQQQKDLISIQELMKTICKSDSFSQFKNSEQTQILKGKNPRLFYSWEKLISRCKFKRQLYKDINGYKSSYAHSEFLSILQIKSKGYGFNANSEVHYTLILVHSILCKSIFDICALFPSVKMKFEKEDPALRDEIVFLKSLSFD